MRRVEAAPWAIVVFYAIVDSARPARNDSDRVHISGDCGAAVADFSAWSGNGLSTAPRATPPDEGSARTPRRRPHVENPVLYKSELPPPRPSLHPPFTGFSITLRVLREEFWKARGRAGAVRAGGAVIKRG